MTDFSQDRQIVQGDQYNADTVIIGITPEQYEEGLKREKKKLLEELAVTDLSDRIVREILELKLTTAVNKLANLNKSYQEKVLKLTEVVRTLEDLKASLPKSRVIDAQTQLKSGNSNAAIELFDDVIAKAEEAGVHGGRAAFENGRIAEDEVRYIDAKNYYKTAIKFQPNNSDYLTALGNILHNLGDYAAAIRLCEQALEQELNMYGEHSLRVAMTRAGLTSFYTSAAQYNDAIESGELALSSIGENHPDILCAALNNLGRAYCSVAEYKKAIECYERALIIGVEIYKENHQLVATIRNNLGFIYDEIGEHDKAIHYYSKALFSDLENFIDNHPDISRDYNNLGLAYKNLKQYDRAVDCYNKALAVDRKVYGENHANVAMTLNNLGMLYASKGLYEKAISYYKEALSIDNKSASQDHVEIAKRRNNLALAYALSNKYAKAVKYFQQSVAMLEVKLGKNHPTMLAVSLNLDMLQKGTLVGQK